MAYKQYLLVFGGEFTSPNQARLASAQAAAEHPPFLLYMLFVLYALHSHEARAHFTCHKFTSHEQRLLFHFVQNKFHHYKELWRLDLTTYKWELLNLRGGPSARREGVIM